MALPRRLVAELLKLPEDDRAELAEVLLGSLEADGIELSAEQETELEASLAEADRGEMVDAEAVLRELREMAAARPAS